MLLAGRIWGLSWPGAFHSDHFSWDHHLPGETRKGPSGGLNIKYLMLHLCFSTSLCTLQFLWVSWISWLSDNLIMILYLFLLLYQILHIALYLDSVHNLGLPEAPLIYTFISCFLYVPWSETEPATLAYQEDMLTSWATRSGTPLFSSSNFLLHLN